MSDLYVPSWAEPSEPAHPIATALPLDVGKRLCHQHFLQRCRALEHRLPAEQRAHLSASALEAISLKWTPRDAGIFEGEPEGPLPPSFASVAVAIYRLRPVD